MATPSIRACIMAFILSVASTSAFSGANSNLTQLSPPGVLDDRWSVTADNERAVFVSPNATAEEIYSVRFDEPGEIVRLSRNAEMSGAAEVVSFDISQDSQYVVFLVKLPGVTGDSETLLSVPIDGSTTPAQLATVDLGMFGAFGIGFDISPLSDRVVYTETTETSESPFSESKLFSQPITGGSAATLHQDALTISFLVSRDGARVVYLTTSATEPGQLFSSPITGGSNVQLNDPDVVPGMILIGPNSERVVFTAFNTEGTSNSLESVPIAGGNQTNLQTPSGENAIGTFAISNNVADPRVVYVEVGETQSRVATVPIAGGSENDLTNGFVDGGISTLVLSPDGQRVVFQVIEELATEGAVEFTSELFSASINGLGPGGVPATFSKGSANDAVFLAFPSFDSTKLVYGAIAQDDTAGDFPGTQEVLSADIEGGSATTLVGPLPGNQRVFMFFPVFDSQSVFYLADQEQDEVLELYTVPIEGGNATKQNETLPPGGDVTSAFSTPDSSKLVYNADQETNDLFDLFVVLLTGPTSEVIFSSGFE